MDVLSIIIEKAERSNYNLGRIDDKSSKIAPNECFTGKFDPNHFNQLADKVCSITLTSDNIYNLTRDDILRYFALFEQTLWYYNDHLMDNRYKIKNLYVLLSLFFTALEDTDLKFLTNSYNNIVQELPLSGVILVSDDRKKVLLVKNNFSKTWSYPKGKINKFETSKQAAVRECLEETGYDVSKQIDHSRTIIKKYNKKIVYLYVVEGVPLDYDFEPQNENEIVEVKWFDLNRSLEHCRDYNIYINKSYSDLNKILR